jgi:hypothetical protein
MQVAKYNRLRRSGKFSSKLKKITHGLHFGYCEGRFRKFAWERCENRKAVDRE